LDYGLLKVLQVPLATDGLAQVFQHNGDGLALLVVILGTGSVIDRAQHVQHLANEFGVVWVVKAVFSHKGFIVLVDGMFQYRRNGDFGRAASWRVDIFAMVRFDGRFALIEEHVCAKLLLLSLELIERASEGLVRNRRWVEEFDFAIVKLHPIRSISGRRRTLANVRVIVPIL
jgi:hypothetical protein